MKLGNLGETTNLKDNTNKVNTNTIIKNICNETTHSFENKFIKKEINKIEINFDEIFEMDEKQREQTYNELVNYLRIKTNEEKRIVIKVDWIKKYNLAIKELFSLYNKIRKDVSLDWKIIFKIDNDFWLQFHKDIFFSEIVKNNFVKIPLSLSTTILEKGDIDNIKLLYKFTNLRKLFIENNLEIDLLLEILECLPNTEVYLKSNLFDKDIIENLKKKYQKVFTIA